MKTMRFDLDKAFDVISFSKISSKKYFFHKGHKKNRNGVKVV